MENTGPNKRQKASGEATDEAHENGKVRDDDCEKDRQNHNSHTEAQAPDFEFAINRPDGWKSGVWFAFEKFFFQ